MSNNSKGAVLRRTDLPPSSPYFGQQTRWSTNNGYTQLRRSGRSTSGTAQPSPNTIQRMYAQHVSSQQSTPVQQAVSQINTQIQQNTQAVNPDIHGVVPISSTLNNYEMLVPQNTVPIVQNNFQQNIQNTTIQNNYNNIQNVFTEPQINSENLSQTSSNSIIISNINSNNQHIYSNLNSHLHDQTQLATQFGQIYPNNVSSTQLMGSIDENSDKISHSNPSLPMADSGNNSGQNSSTVSPTKDHSNPLSPKNQHLAEALSVAKHRNRQLKDKERELEKKIAQQQIKENNLYAEMNSLKTQHSKQMFSMHASLKQKTNDIELVRNDAKESETNYQMVLDERSQVHSEIEGYRDRIEQLDQALVKAKAERDEKMAELNVFQTIKEMRHLHHTHISQALNEKLIQSRSYQKDLSSKYENTHNSLLSAQTDQRKLEKSLDEARRHNMRYEEKRREWETRRVRLDEEFVRLNNSLLESQERADQSSKQYADLAQNHLEMQRNREIIMEERDRARQEYEKCMHERDAIWGDVQLRNKEIIELKQRLQSNDSFRQTATNENSSRSSNRNSENMNSNSTSYPSSSFRAADSKDSGTFQSDNSSSFVNQNNSQASPPNFQNQVMNHEQIIIDLDTKFNPNKPPFTICQDKSNDGTTVYVVANVDSNIQYSANNGQVLLQSKDVILKVNNTNITQASFQSANNTISKETKTCKLKLIIKRIRHNSGQNVNSEISSNLVNNVNFNSKFNSNSSIPRISGFPSESYSNLISPFTVQLNSDQARELSRRIELGVYVGSGIVPDGSQNSVNRSGLAHGDKLISINGTNLQQKSPADVCSMLRQSRTVVSITATRSLSQVHGWSSSRMSGTDRLGLGLGSANLVNGQNGQNFNIHSGQNLPHPPQHCSASSVAHSVSSMSIVSRSSLPGNIGIQQNFSRDTLAGVDVSLSDNHFGIRKNEVNTLGRYGSIRKKQNPALTTTFPSSESHHNFTLYTKSGQNSNSNMNSSHSINKQPPSYEQHANSVKNNQKQQYFATSHQNRLYFDQNGPKKGLNQNQMTNQINQFNQQSIQQFNQNQINHQNYQNSLRRAQQQQTFIPSGQNGQKLQSGQNDQQLTQNSQHRVQTSQNGKMSTQNTPSTPVIHKKSASKSSVKQANTLSNQTLANALVSSVPSTPSKSLHHNKNPSTITTDTVLGITNHSREPSDEPELPGNQSQFREMEVAPRQGGNLKGSEKIKHAKKSSVSSMKSEGGLGLQPLEDRQNEQSSVNSTPQTKERSKGIARLFGRLTRRKNSNTRMNNPMDKTNIFGVEKAHGESFRSTGSKNSVSGPSYSGIGGHPGQHSHGNVNVGEINFGSQTMQNMQGSHSSLANTPRNRNSNGQLMRSLSMNRGRQDKFVNGVHDHQNSSSSGTKS
jgi:hypothetical protein